MTIRMIWRRIVCAIIGHDYTGLFRCLRCQAGDD